MLKLNCKTAVGTAAGALFGTIVVIGIDKLVEKKFEGSLPSFIAAFTKRQDLSEKELDEVQRMIDRIRKGG